MAVVFGASLAAGVAARYWSSETTAVATPSASARRGAVLYTMHCARCHGDEGHGDAEGAERLTPPPRDFASRPWRFEPTAPSIERVLREGIAGTSMPAFGATLPVSDLEALTQHVLRLSGSDAADAGATDLFRLAQFTALKPPRAAPTLALESATGARRSLGDFRGKVVLLNFWGVSCEHCLARMPGLAKFLQQLNSPDLVVLNICADEDDAQQAQELLHEVAPELTAYTDPSGLANGRYEVSLLPTLWLVDREGNLVAKGQGARDWEDPALRTLVEDLLSSPVPTSALRD
jgi:mono/diheme cytochrome c family protein/peroxiredoxin